MPSRHISRQKHHWMQLLKKGQILGTLKETSFLFSDPSVKNSNYNEGYCWKKEKALKKKKNQSINNWQSP